MTDDALAAAMQRATDWDAMSPVERADLVAALRQVHVARNAHEEHLAARTFGERLADRIALFGGSWTFIIIFFGVLAAWTGRNTFLLSPRGRAFDAYPYIFLNLILSMLAALQAPIIMMSQQRQAARDRVDAQSDYEVNLKAEIEIRALHEKLDALREAQWAELVQLQHDQIAMLTHLLRPPATADATARG